VSAQGSPFHPTIPHLVCCNDFRDATKAAAPLLDSQHRCRHSQAQTEYDTAALELVRALKTGSRQRPHHRPAFTGRFERALARIRAENCGEACGPMQTQWPHALLLGPLGRS
jgi:hypothetical protein